MFHTAFALTFRDWILLVCFSWRYEATEDPLVNFEKREAKRFSKFTRGSSVASYLHEKQTSRIQSLYLYFNYSIKIVPFWLRNIRFFNTKHPVIILRRHYSSLHRLMSLHRKLNVKIFLMCFVAENTGSVNIIKSMLLFSVKSKNANLPLKRTKIPRWIIQQGIMTHLYIYSISGIWAKS